MEWSLEGILEWNGVRFLVFVTLQGHNLRLRQTATEWSGVRFWRDEPVGYNLDKARPYFMILQKC